MTIHYDTKSFYTDNEKAHLEKPRYVHGARIVPGKDNEEEDGKLSNPSWRKTATDWACAPNFPP